MFSIKLGHLLLFCLSFSSIVTILTVSPTCPLIVCLLATDLNTNIMTHKRVYLLCIFTVVQDITLWFETDTFTCRNVGRLMQSSACGMTKLVSSLG